MPEAPSNEFEDYDAFNAGPLEFPYRGKTYVVPLPDFDTGATLTRITSGEDTEFRSKPVQEIWKLLLGPVWDELVADKVPFTFIARCGLTALTDFQYGRDLAKAAWKAGGDPKALASYLPEEPETPSPNRAAKRAASKRSPSTGGVNETP